MSKIVGGVGFILSHVSKTLAKGGHEVVILDNLDNYYPQDLKRFNIEFILKADNTTFIESDVTNLITIKNIIDVTVDYDFHETAQASIKLSVENPFKSKNFNFLGTLNVIQASKEPGIERIIKESPSVYGNVHYLTFDEKHPIEPVSQYGVSKLTRAKLTGFYKTYGIPTVSLRIILRYITRE